MNRDIRPGRVARLRAHRFQLALLFVPLARVVGVPLGFSPAQFDDSLVQPTVRILALVLLGLGAVVGIVGVLAEWVIVERAGMHLLAPLSVAYAIVLLTADWHSAVVSAAIYLVLAAACAGRAAEITRSMRLMNRTLTGSTGKRIERDAGAS